MLRNLHCRGSAVAVCSVVQANIGTTRTTGGTTGGAFKRTPGLLSAVWTDSHVQRFDKEFMATPYRAPGQYKYCRKSYGELMALLARCNSTKPTDSLTNYTDDTPGRVYTNGSMLEKHFTRNKSGDLCCKTCLQDIDDHRKSLRPDRKQRVDAHEDWEGGQGPQGKTGGHLQAEYDMRMETGMTGRVGARFTPGTVNPYFFEKFIPESNTDWYQDARLAPKYMLFDPTLTKYKSWAKPTLGIEHHTSYHTVAPRAVQAKMRKVMREATYGPTVQGAAAARKLAEKEERMTRLKVAHTEDLQMIAAAELPENIQIAAQKKEEEEKYMLENGGALIPLPEGETRPPVPGSSLKYVACEVKEPTYKIYQGVPGAMATPVAELKGHEICGWSKIQL